MRPIRLCICFCKQFEKTFEYSLWRKIVQMQPIMGLRFCSLRWFENTFETHTAEKLYKCNYASVLAVNLRRHLKTQSWEKSFKCNQRDLHMFIQTIWENTWKLTLEKVIEMQPKRLCICFGTQFEKTFENLLWKKVFKMQSMWQCICSDRQFANIWKLTPEKSCTIATNATLHLFWQAFWEDVWKLTLEKNRTNATNALMHLFRQAIWGHIWKLT